MNWFLENKTSWEKTGLLDGLSDTTKDIVSKHFDKVDFERLKWIEDSIPPWNKTQPKASEYILPSIRRIITAITDGDQSIHDVTEEELLNLVDVNEITELLIIYCRGFIPHAITFLSHLDAEAEAVCLFCENYILKIIDTAKQRCRLREALGSRLNLDN
jgi:hypothetical protein